MRIRRIILTVLLISTPVFIAGCLAAAVGIGAVGTVAYLKGDLEVVEAADIDTVYAAAQKAVRQLDMIIVEQRKDKLSGLIVARDSQDTKITIKLNATAEGPTKLSIRTGVFGNETRSMIIYQKIRDNLKTQDTRLKT